MSYIWYGFCKNYSLNVNFLAKKLSFSFQYPPPPHHHPQGGEKRERKNWIITARTLTFNKQYLHKPHQIYDEKYYSTSKFTKASQKQFSFLIPKFHTTRKYILLLIVMTKSTLNENVFNIKFKGAICQ
jgi:hypothetical protein